MYDEKDTVVVEYDEFHSEGFKHPCTFYILNPLGQYVFLKGRGRKKAQEVLERYHEKGKYKLHTYKQEGDFSTVNAR